MTLLWHGDEPIGICVLTAPPVSLGPRNRYFGRTGNWNRISMQAMNRQLAMLSRVVLHPAYRGAGLAARFVRHSCELSGIPWIETLAAMGNVNPFFEKAGFVRVGPTRVKKNSRAEHSTLYGRPSGARPIRVETFEKSRRAAPVYYIFDNRDAAQRSRAGKEAEES